MSITQVIELDSYRPSLEGIALCEFCRDSWDFSLPIVDVNKIPYLECPTCKGYHGKILEAEYSEPVKRK